MTILPSSRREAPLDLRRRWDSAALALKDSYRWLRSLRRFWIFIKICLATAAGAAIALGCLYALGSVGDCGAEQSRFPEWWAALACEPEFRRAALTGVSALAASPVLLLLWYWRTTFRDRELSHTERAHSDRVRDDRLAKGAELVASDKELVRTVGILLLGEVASGKEADDNWRVVVQLLPALKRGKVVGTTAGTSESSATIADASGRPDEQAAQTVWQRLIRTRPGETVSLPDADLRGADFSDASLGRANFARANLSNAKLDASDLQKANLAGAKLQAASMARANLRRAVLDGCSGSHVSLQGATLHDASATGEGTHLRYAVFDDANLANADFHDAVLDNSSFMGATLRGTNLHGADLRNGDFRGAIIRGADLRGNLEGARWLGAKADRETRFPEGFDLEKERIEFVD